MGTILFFGNDPQINVWIKIAYTAFVVVIVPFYWKHWGAANFLWFSDLALFLGVPALWLESKLLGSILAVGVLLPELYWNVELLLRTVTGHKFAGLTGYMWDKKRPLFLRLLSLFHVILPAAIILMLQKYGYEPSAIYYQAIFSCLVLLLCYKFTRPEKNINWVFGFGNKPQNKFSPPVYLLLLMLSYLFFVYVPTHFLLKAIF